jgi:uncharacterized membrane protein
LGLVLGLAMGLALLVITLRRFQPITDARGYQRAANAVILGVVAGAYVLAVIWAVIQEPADLLIAAASFFPLAVVILGVALWACSRTTTWVVRKTAPLADQPG